jgi:hypothetical protein
MSDARRVALATKACRLIRENNDVTRIIVTDRKKNGRRNGKNSLLSLHLPHGQWRKSDKCDCTEDLLMRCGAARSASRRRDARWWEREGEMIRKNGGVAARTGKR